MPDVTGKKLDDAKSAIKDAGFDDEVKVDGGGLFGVVDGVELGGLRAESGCRHDCGG